jgi:cyclopropane fatty-acyl-phospholipid synthase-like methyltransferase
LKRIKIKLPFKPFWKTKSFSSSEYWEDRYRGGRNSGPGSYNELGEFKAEILNQAIRDYHISKVTEFGCGDGAILSLLQVNAYIGLDVSKTVINSCINKFQSDQSKRFFIYNADTFTVNHQLYTSDAAFSVDVIFHITEQELFEKYLEDLFSSASKLVVIYGADLDHRPKTEHELYRKFTGYIENKFPEWKLDKMVKNRYPAKDYKDQSGSLCDFFFYIRA